MSDFDLTELATARRLIASGIGRRLRQREGLSLRELAAGCGTTAPTIARWEAGEVKNPRPAAAVAYARWLRRVLGDEQPAPDRTGH